MTPKEAPLLLQDRPTAEHLNRLGTILCCPKTKGPLRLIAADSLFSQLPPAARERLPPGTIAAFVSEKAAVAYPATAQIVSFLDRDAVPLNEMPAAVVTDAAEEVKRAVREWYDTFGWQKNESGEYHDTAAYSQTRPVG